MKRTLIIGIIGLLAHTLSAAESGPKDKVATATKQLAEKSNYSWTTSTKEADGSQGRMGPIEGKAAKDGVTYLSFTISDVPVEVSRRPAAPPLRLCAICAATRPRPPNRLTSLPK